MHEGMCFTMVCSAGDSIGGQGGLQRVTSAGLSGG